MTASDVRIQPSVPADPLAADGRGGDGRPSEMAPRNGPDRADDEVRVGPAAPCPDGVDEQNHEPGFWWVA